MKKKINYMSTFLIVLLMLTVILLIFPLYSHAAPAYEGLFKLTQPSGISFEARKRGDEWYHWVETEDGYGIYHNKKTGNWEYYVPSKDPKKEEWGVIPDEPFHAVVGDVHPSALNIPKGLRPPRKQPPMETGLIEKIEKAPVSGAIPLLVICVYYEDTPYTFSHTDIQPLFFGSSGSVADYYHNVSYNTVTITRPLESDGTANDGIIGWLPLSGNHPNPTQYTDPKTEYIAYQQIAKDAILASAEFINYISYDKDGNDVVEPKELSICIMVAGYEATIGDPMPTPSVWAHRGSMSLVGYPCVDGITPLCVGGVTIEKYALFGEIHEDHLATIGVICHELGHLRFNLSDLYDTTPEKEGDSYGVGDFDLMGSGNWGARADVGTSSVPIYSYAGSSPTHLSAWSKEYLSWGTVNTVSTNQEISLPKSDGNSNSIFRINTTDTNQYFLLENRQFTGYDEGFEKNAGVNGNGGLVIYHIDELKTALWTGGSNTVNADVNDKGVDVEEANEGKETYSMLDTRIGSHTAHTEMFFFKQNKQSFNSFTDTTTPNSKLKNGKSNNISVTDISDSKEVMSAKVTLYATFIAQKIAAGADHTLAVKDEGSVWAWGGNQYGQLGIGTTTSGANHTPLQVSGISDIVAVDGGPYHTLALKSDGTVWAWGSTHAYPYGAFALNANPPEEILTTPVQVCLEAICGPPDDPCSCKEYLSDVRSISCGSGHSVALRLDGTVWTWGQNYEGELGIACALGIDAHTAAQVCILPDPDCDDDYPNACMEPLSNIIAIASGCGFTLALKSDGTVWRWGAGFTDSAIMMSNLNDVISIAAGGGHIVALKSDGTVWTLGNNKFGQLGDGSTFTRLEPVQVIGLSDVKAIGCGYSHTLAVKSDGTVWAWGNNRNGQLGIGTSGEGNYSAVPLQVQGLTDIVAVDGDSCGSGFDSYSVALENDGTVWAWGYNGFGQLGDSTTNMSNIPVQADINLSTTETPTPTPKVTETPTETETPTVTETPTPTATATPVSCDIATSITSSSSTVIVEKGNSTTVTVTVTGANGCAVTNDTVKATSNNTSIATVPPYNVKTNAIGQAIFTITGKKKGSAKVTFKETTVNLKTKTKIKVTK